MRLTYDTEVDALTIVVSRESVERTADVGNGRFVDLDEDGNVVALEILDASSGFELRDLMNEYDLQAMLEGLATQIGNARRALHEDAFLRDLVA